MVLPIAQIAVPQPTASTEQGAWTFRDLQAVPMKIGKSLFLGLEIKKWGDRNGKKLTAVAA